MKDRIIDRIESSNDCPSIPIESDTPKRYNKEKMAAIFPEPREFPNSCLLYQYPSAIYFSIMHALSNCHGNFIFHTKAFTKQKNVKTTDTINIKLSSENRLCRRHRITTK